MTLSVHPSPAAPRCFVNAAAQVSCQKPLSDEWMEAPCTYPTPYARAIEPDTKGLILPAEARRMSKILKRTVCTSITALNHSSIREPQAIVTGTGMGCIENSEKFLVDLCTYGENCLKPTLFMQSTHNTISSLVAIILKCHGYNNTYSHKGISFESALLDAWIQMRGGMISNALVGSHDEVTPFMNLVMRRTHPEYTFVSEASMAAVLTTSPSDQNLCEVAEVRLFHRPRLEDVAEAIGDSPALMLGVNGHELTDTPYLSLLSLLPHSPLLLHYKPLFGDNFSASALGFYAACKLLATGSLPSHMLYRPTEQPLPDEITLLNHCDGTVWSLVRLKRCSLPAL